MNKKILLIIALLLMIIILLRLFVGHVYIKAIIPYKNPIYKLEINGETKGAGMEVMEKTTIVPGILSFISSAHLFPLSPRFELNYGDKIIMDITGYYCFTDISGKKSQVSCVNYDHKYMEEIDNINCTHMIISGGSEVGVTNDMVYQGEYKDDITDLLSHKGIYVVKIELEHNKTNSTLEYTLDLK